jgi:pyrimidine-specific ribonucleoside hydrolase
VDETLYKPEYDSVLHTTLEKFGPVEWKAISMTNEIHGHTGIYSIIGAKLGIRAMEYFNVGINNMEVTSFAGNKPPLSCFNDGIQISTGATIGQGLITISDSISTVPTAIFEFNDQQVKISLKPEIAEQMQKDIRYGVQTYGLLTDPYWLYIEDLALRYWSEFSRFEICDFTPLRHN